MSDDIRLHLTAYLDGELGPAERNAVRQAIEADPALARELEAIEVQQALLRRTPNPTAPDALWPRIATGLHRQPVRFVFRRWVIRTAGLGAAACLLVVAGLVVWPGAGPESPVALPEQPVNPLPDPMAGLDIVDVTGLPAKETIVLDNDDRLYLQALHETALNYLVEGKVAEARAELRAIDAMLHKRGTVPDETWVRRLSELRVLVNEVYPKP